MSSYMCVQKVISLHGFDAYLKKENKKTNKFVRVGGGGGGGGAVGMTGNTYLKKLHQDIEYSPYSQDFFTVISFKH